MSMVLREPTIEDDIDYVLGEVSFALSADGFASAEIARSAECCIRERIKAAIEKGDSFDEIIERERVIAAFRIENQA